MPRNILVTVFSDASFRDGIAGFHFWFKSERHCNHGSGSAGGVTSACHAELLGIHAAIVSATAAHGSGTPLDYVVQCDSTQAMGTLLAKGARVANTSKLKFNAPKSITADENQVAMEIHEMTLHGQIYLKHVKGHTARNDKRSFLNRKNDAGANEARLKHQPA